MTTADLARAEIAAHAAMLAAPGHAIEAAHRDWLAARSAVIAAVQAGAIVEARDGRRFTSYRPGRFGPLRKRTINMGARS